MLHFTPLRILITTYNYHKGYVHWLFHNLGSHIFVEKI